ncbi:Eukaryotic initiation factor 4E family protein [Tritrichomonas foetus]|uniref:Eukaryotic initiation factor 4E family protein n=1 Tax=Tritrichomonas foetus TaxID=1144522 RepID=A0A1J4JUN4_9EUKA|nr:Eukaryotic initiation factor 4E family protein [Tritrichomonas foetus]|eukprot:OHT01230.1 Eukaryotic initiation factor 4E family protein [Tritrichomonas foetus]
MENSTGDDRLYRVWSFWYLIPDRSLNRNASWREFLHEMGEISKIDQLWATLNSVEQPSKLPKGCRYYIFKRGVAPLWEDSKNLHGYEISIEHPILKAKRQKISDRFIDVVLSVLGETFSHSESINGLEFTVRAGTYKIAIWTKAIPDEEREVIANELLKIVNWKSQVKIETITVSTS